MSSTRMKDRLARPGAAGWFAPRHDELRSALEAHLAAEVEPPIPAWEAAGSVPLHDVLAGLAAGGWLGSRFPPEIGGQGGDIWDHVVFAECLGGLTSDSVGMAVTVHNDMVAPMIAAAGSADAVETFLRPAMTGRYVLAHAVSEADAGSDVAAVAATATAVTGGYRLTGTKRWVVGGTQADAFAVLARLPESRGPFGHVLLMVPATEATVTPAAPTLGLRAAALAGAVEFADVFVPDGHRLGGHGLGLVVQLKQFEQERIISACRALAIARRVLATTRAWLAGRSTFGAPIGTRQDVQFRLNRHTIELEAARQLAYTAIDRWATGGEYRALSAAVKLRSSRLACEVARDCLHLHGAHGQLVAAPVNRAYRDARLFSISTGSDEMMLTTIARLAGWGVA
jgi:citronellyl-CoA dehydrogenase